MSKTRFLTCDEKNHDKLLESARFHESSLTMDHEDHSRDDPESSDTASGSSGDELRRRRTNEI